MAYYNDDRLSRRGKAARRLLDNFEASTKRSEAARQQYNRADYDKPMEEE